MNHRLPSLVEDRLRIKEVRGRLRRRAARSSRGASSKKVRNFYLAFSRVSSLGRHLAKCCCDELLVPKLICMMLQQVHLPSLVQDRLRIKLEVRGRLRRRATRSSRGASSKKVRNFYLACSWVSSLERHLSECCCGKLAPTILFLLCVLVFAGQPSSSQSSTADTSNPLRNMISRGSGQPSSPQSSTSAGPTGLQDLIRQLQLQNSLLLQQMTNRTGSVWRCSKSYWEFVKMLEKLPLLKMLKNAFQAVGVPFPM
jgi:hypothetical protein